MDTTYVASPGFASRDRRGHQTRGIVAYLALTFGLAWLPFLAAALGAGVPGPLLMPVAPAIACLVVRRWVTREGFGDAGLRPNLRRWPLLLLVLRVALVVHPLRVALALALGGTPAGFTFPWGLAAPTPRDLLIWSLLPLAAAPLLLGEELGWRGYLQIRLLAGRPLLAAVATGAIWGIWHAPLILTGGEATDQRLATLLLFPLATTISSAFLGWLRLRTGDVWAPSVAHTANNVAADPLSRLGFAGRANGVLPLSAVAPSLLAEVLVFGTIIAVDQLRRHWPGAGRWGWPGGATWRCTGHPHSGEAPPHLHESRVTPSR